MNRNHNNAELAKAYARITPDLIESYIHDFKGDHQSLLELFASYMRFENHRILRQVYRLFLDDGTIDKVAIAKELEELEAQMDNLVIYLEGAIGKK